MVYLVQWQLHGTSALPFIPSHTPETHMRSMHFYITYTCPLSMFILHDVELETVRVKIPHELTSPTLSTLAIRRSMVKREKRKQSYRWGNTRVQWREKCVCLRKTKRVPPTPCSNTKSISHSLTSPPLWCHSFIPFSVAMATLPLEAVCSFSSLSL